jgi:hypothetical protein
MSTVYVVLNINRIMLCVYLCDGDMLR